VVGLRWPDASPAVCGSEKVYLRGVSEGWECATRHPHRKFTLKTGTVFEDSPIGLDKWLPAVWMIVNMKNGVSSHELAASLGVTQKTGVVHAAPHPAGDAGPHGGKLGGDVEVDETYIGGKAREHARQ